MVKKESIFVICAHSDDQILGPGGTLAKYAKEGKEIFTIIFSYGETSHFWLKKKVSVKIRVKEAQAADKVIGGSGVVFFGLIEGKFLEEAKDKQIKDKIEKLIKEKKPIKIFTHSVDDAHNDHRAVYKIVTELTEDTKYKGDLLSFDIWHIMDLKKRGKPKLYVDITPTFKVKLKALKCFESQKLAMLFPYINVYINAFINGLKNDCKYAEKFYKIK